jgi:hypothetical protein
MSVLPQTGTAGAKFGCNILPYIALGQSQQHLMAEAPWGSGTRSFYLSKMPQVRSLGMEIFVLFDAMIGLLRNASQEMLTVANRVIATCAVSEPSIEASQAQSVHWRDIVASLQWQLIYPTQQQCC